MYRMRIKSLKAKNRRGEIERKKRWGRKGNMCKARTIEKKKQREEGGTQIWGNEIA